MRRIGILTSGGDCQALNATMRGVAKSLYNMLDDVEIIGFEDGYKGLMYADYQIMKPADFSGILTQGGTILGTSRQPFKQMRVPDENGLDKVEAMKHTYKKLKLSCLVVLCGNGDEPAFCNKQYKEKYRSHSFKVEYLMLYHLYFSCLKFC